MVAAVSTWIANAAAAAASAAGASAGTVAAVQTVAYYGAQIAFTVGIGVALKGAQGTPDPGSVKGSKRQPIPPRMKVWGRRGKVGGYYLLWEAVDNYAYDAVYFAEGPNEAAEQIWSHDKVLNFVGGGASGWVAGSPEYGGGSNDLIHVEFRLGLPTETAYPALVAALGGAGVWTSDCRGDGLMTLGADYHHAKKENLLKDFPNSDPSWSMTGRWSRIWDPRVAGEVWGQPLLPGHEQVARGNLGLQILDHCMDPRGMAMDFETEILPALEHWKGEFDICDEWVLKKDGTSERRYWGSGYAAIPDDPQDTLNKMLAACDGKLLKDQHGVWRLWVGKYRAPTVHLTVEDCPEYDLAGDEAAFDQANELVPKFVDEVSGWNLIPTTAWRDDEAIARVGRRVSSDVALEWCNSGSQARRVTKAVLRRNTAPLRGAIPARLSAADALGQRWISVDLPDLGLPGQVFEMNDGGVLALSRGGVDLNVVAADPQAYDWDPDTEEESPVVVTRPPVEPLSPPTITSVTSFATPLGTSYALRLRVSGVGPSREDLTWYVRWQTTGSTSWSTEEITDEAAGPPFTGDTGLVPSDTALQVQLGYQTATSGTLWSSSAGVGPFALTLMSDESDALMLAEDGSPMMME